MSQLRSKPQQTLANLQPNSSAYFACWLELREICGNYKLWPQSYVLSAPDLEVAERPFASIGPYDAHEGLLNGSKVCVKQLRMYSVEGPKDDKRVRC